MFDLLKRLLTTRYVPDPTYNAFLSRAESQQDPRARVTVAVLDGTESERLFGVPLSRRGLQAMYLRIENTSQEPLRLQLVASTQTITPHWKLPPPITSRSSNVCRHSAWSPGS